MAFYLPPLERAIWAISSVSFAWAFVASDTAPRRRSVNIAALLLVMLIVLGYLVVAVPWAVTAVPIDFNLRYGLPWAVIVAVLNLVAFGLVLLYRPVDAPVKSLVFLAMALGQAASIAQGEVLGNISGWGRLGFMAALLVVPIIVFRAIMRLEAHPPQAQRTPALASQEVPRVVKPVVSQSDSQSALLLRALGQILEDPSPLLLPQRIVEATTHMLKADLGAILRLQDANYADVLYGYDRVKERPIKALSLNLDQQMTLVNAIERRAQRALFMDRNSDELADLYTRLDIEQRGPVYFQPLTQGEKIVGVLMIALPYLNRELDNSALELLKGLAIMATGLLVMSYEAQEAREMVADRTIQALVEGVALSEVKEDAVIAARQEMQASLKLAREQVSELSRQVMLMKIKLDEERRRILKLLGTEEDLSISQRIQAINQDHERLRQERDQLVQKLQEAEAALNAASATSEAEAINSMVTALCQEKEALIAERDRLQAQLNDLQASDLADALKARQLLQSLAQERVQLTHERDQLSDQLSDLQSRLKALGLEEGADGLTQIVGRLTGERNALIAKVETLTQERDVLLNERFKLAETISREQERDARLQALQAQVENLAADREAALKQRDRLRQEVEELQHKLDAVKEHRVRLLAQVSGLEMELSEVREEQVRMVASYPPPLSPEVPSPVQPDLLVGLVQELRTPLTSMIGYVDLLLNESAGILGEMQRKFLQRVSANISRLTAMIADLIKVSQLDAGLYRLEATPIDTIALIEQAITSVSVQLREKGITVNLDLDDTLPPLPADADAFSQIIGQLLTNAYLVSPPNSAISIIARREPVIYDPQVGPIDSAYFAVEDRGGGIPSDEIPRVFARKYKAENPLIVGLGDTGVGLSIAKALVEAHMGRLWVVSKVGKGSIFNFAIPYERHALSGEANDG
ncbi:MAG: ATP-binding protein [Anaerolineae bacterium]|nr:ATP-binding protein [Anaerolineae bacterium]MDW8173319.1 ATP-binding protein [Anaerolineae bacterium]